MKTSISKNIPHAVRLSPYRIFDNMLEGCQIISPEWQYLYVNDTVAQHAGLSKEELLDGSMLNLFPGIEHTPLFSKLRQCMENKKPDQMENLFTFPDGSSNYYDLRFLPVPEGILILSLDITERKVAELRIEHLNKVLRTIRNVNQLIVHEKNRDKLIREGCRLITESRGYTSALIILTNPSSQPVSWGESGYRNASLQLSALLKRGLLPPCHDICQPVNRVFIIENRSNVCCKCPLYYSYPKQQVMCVRLVHNHSDFGSLVVSLESGSMIDTEERDLFLEMAGDIAYALDSIQKDAARKESERKSKSLELQLIQAQKMESIGTLAGGIAHDFNNILFSIIGYTELSLEEVEKGSLIKQNLQEIYAAGKRAKDLVKQILTFARKSEEEVKPLKIGEIVEDGLKFIRASIPATIAIDKSITSASLVMGNTTQIHQLLMNLCTNAFHAMEENGGTLGVRLTDIIIDDSAPFSEFSVPSGKYIKLEVSDTGKGIPEEHLKSIFEPYFTTKKPGEGTGLGLAVVHGIVESYSGKINVSSAPGAGTRFVILLPVTQNSRMDIETESENLYGGSERILLIDDEKPITKIGHRMLTRIGYSVTAVTDGMAALALFKTNPKEFDLIITDMTMPNITGDKLASEVMRIRKDIPVILCTGYSKKMTIETAEAIGIKAVVNKPILKADFIKTIRKVLDSAPSSKK